MRAKPEARPRSSLGRRIAFSPRLVPHINAILQMRYCRKSSVDQVQDHLASIGVICHVSALHNFIRRVLTMFPADLSAIHQVDVRLLKAVRRRLRMPLQPPRRRQNTARKALPRFACVGGPAPVRPRGPAKTRSTSSKQSFEHRDPLGQKSALAPAAVRTCEEALPASGEPTLSQWKAISIRALAKLPDHVCPWNGDVFDTRSRRPISESSLVADYRLSQQEAKSLFLTL